MGKEIDRDVDGVPKPKFNNRDSIILAVIIIVFMIIAYILFV